VPRLKVEDKRACRLTTALESKSLPLPPDGSPMVFPENPHFSENTTTRRVRVPEDKRRASSQFKGWGGESAL
jgi:hypothetical protein